MRDSRIPTHLFLSILLASSGLSTASAQDAKSDDGEKDSPKLIRVHLMEGSVVTGRLSVEELTVDTKFGVLTVPVENIVSFTPGLDSHPAERRRIGRLIQQLGSKVVKERDEAQRSLIDIGPGVRPQLLPYENDDDAERKTRIQKILEELTVIEEENRFEGEEARPLIAADAVKTDLFSVVGEISPEEFEVHTQFGPLDVALSDVRFAEHISDEKPEVRKTVTVAGANLVQTNLKNSGIRLERGDKVSIRASGSIVMSPWGNNVTSTPDGGANFQWYVPNKIPGGALVGRIGNTGRVFKIGSRHTFTATRAGTLYLAVAMNSQFANQGYNYPGQYTAKIRVNPE